MGLDMYLEARVHVSGYEFCAEQERELYGRILDATCLRDAADPHTPSASISVTVAYWRKANHIHKWFVDNVQDGKDDCGSYYVEREQLEQLRSLCKRVVERTKLVPGKVHVGTRYQGGVAEEMYEDGQVIEDTAVAAEILPTTSGFFFGGTDYDEWYFRDTEQTIAQIDRALNVADRVDFYYSSSW